MELRTFITQALLDIAHGVSDAQAQVQSGTEIVPRTSDTIESAKSGLTRFQSVAFEICVTVDESKGSEGKIGVVSSLIGASMAGKSSNDSQKRTTISFAVPIAFDTVPIKPTDSKALAGKR